MPAPTCGMAFISFSFPINGYSGFMLSISMNPSIGVDFPCQTTDALTFILPVEVVLWMSTGAVPHYTSTRLEKDSLSPTILPAPSTENRMCSLLRRLMLPLSSVMAAITVTMSEPSA